MKTGDMRIILLGMTLAAALWMPQAQARSDQAVLDTKANRTATSSNAPTYLAMAGSGFDGKQAGATALDGALVATAALPATGVLSVGGGSRSGAGSGTGTKDWVLLLMGAFLILTISQRRARSISDQ